MSKMLKNQPATIYCVVTIIFSTKSNKRKNRPMALDINSRAFSRLTYIQLWGSIRVTGCSYVHDLFEISFFFIITNLLFCCCCSPAFMVLLLHTQILIAERKKKSLIKLMFSISWMCIYIYSRKNFGWRSFVYIILFFSRAHKEAK